MVLFSGALGTGGGGDGANGVNVLRIVHCADLGPSPFDHDVLPRTSQTNKLSKSYMPSLETFRPWA